MPTYRDLISEKAFLQVQKRAGILEGAYITNVVYSERELIFSVPSASGNGAYDVRVIINDLDRRKTASMTYKEIEKVIRQSNLRVRCNCPAFKYWGFKYIATVNGYGISVESRSPSIRNPKLRGKICKHIYKALQAYPFIVDIIIDKLTNGRA